MKQYEQPVMELVLLTTEDILTASSGFPNGQGGDGNVGGEKFD